MLSPSGYLLCGTPRTGSTLLCSLLLSTGVLGRPESYFREPDEAMWARRMGVAVSDGRARDYRAFVQAVREAATTDNGVLGARIMWGSLLRIRQGLHEPHGGSDLAVLEGALGPLAVVFLLREDIVGQAISWCRAEQTGFWQQGDVAVRPPKQDLTAIKHSIAVIREHNDAWRSWFRGQGVVPVQLTYEQLVHDPRSAVQAVADRLQVAIPAIWQPVSHHQQQADRTNREWAAALRAAIPDDCK